MRRLAALALFLAALSSALAQQAWEYAELHYSRNLIRKIGSVSVWIGGENFRGSSGGDGYFDIALQEVVDSLGIAAASRPRTIIELADHLGAEGWSSSR